MCHVQTRKRVIIFIFLCCFVLNTWGHAQVRNNVTTQNIRTQDKILTVNGDLNDGLCPHDTIRISVNHEQFKYFNGEKEVDERIRLPLIGEISLKRKSIHHVAHEISQNLQNYGITAQVEVELIEKAYVEVCVTGDVSTPGCYGLKKDRHIKEALVQAGYSASFNAKAHLFDEHDLVNGITTPRLIMDVQQIFVEDVSAQNISLCNRDMILVIQDESPTSRVTTIPQSKQIWVLGSVKKPGRYEYHPNDTVLDVIRRAGGFTEMAVLNKIKVIRGQSGMRTTYKLRIKDALKKGKIEENIPILPDDVIIVPECLC